MEPQGGSERPEEGSQKGLEWSCRVLGGSQRSQEGLGEIHEDSGGPTGLRQAGEVLGGGAVLSVFLGGSEGSERSYGAPDHLKGTRKDSGEGRWGWETHG